MRLKLVTTAAVAAVSLMWAGSAFAASDATNDASIANTAVASVAAPVASSQTASLIGGSIGSALSGSFGSSLGVGGGGTGGGFGGDGIAPIGGPQSMNFFNTRAMTGVAGGGAMKKAGMWVQGGYTSIDVNDIGGQFDGNVTNVLAGLDFKPNDNSVVGVALGYESLDLTTTFNTGTLKNKGYSITPYGGLVLGNGVALDGMIGISKLNYDATNTNRTVTGSFDATRYMASLNASKAFKGAKFTIVPKVGVMQIREKQDAYTDSAAARIAGNTINLGRASAGGTFAINSDKFSPYLRAMAEYDYDKEKAVSLGNGRVSSNDKFGINAAVGANAKINDKLTFNVEASSAANLRDNTDVYGVTGRLRYDF